MTNFTKIALSIAAIASLNACGGGGGSSTPADTTTGGETPTTTTVVPGAGAIHSDNTVAIDTVSFENVVLNGSSTEARFTGTSAAALKAKFEAGTGNSIDTASVPVSATTVTTTVTMPSGCIVPSNPTLSGDLTGCTHLTVGQTWILDGLVVATNGSELYIDAGTKILGNPGAGDQTSYLIIDKGAKIFAKGTADKPIIFTSVDDTVQEVGLWGGLTIIGNAGNDQVKAYEANSLFSAGGGKDEAGNTVPGQKLDDNSGVLQYVKILNSGITMETDKEINGLSLIGVGSKTVIDNITVDYSDDDGIESWGGTVNMSNITISNCTDDHFDIDDGYAGTVKNLKITQTSGNAAMEMSGTTSATFDGLTIVQNKSGKEGVVFFKGAGIGGHFKNASITDNVNPN